MIKFLDILKEYSDKTINTTIERWKKNEPNLDINMAKSLIQRFDQIKNHLSQKLDTAVLSVDLRKDSNYKNLEKYSFDDMSKLIRSLPENPDKVKKEAVDIFVRKEAIDRPMAQSYVARFMAKKETLKHAVENGMEDPVVSKEEVRRQIPKRLLPNNGFLDPRNWIWHDFENMLDALFPSERKIEGGTENRADTDADKVYSKNGIEIFKGDTVHKCISYNPYNLDKTKAKYGWCVVQPGNINYDNYRLDTGSPTFYFVFDRNKTSAPGHKEFEDVWHVFVIQVYDDEQTYFITDADNRINQRVGSWEGISEIVPADTWAKIKDLKSYFKPIPLTPVERGKKFAKGKNLSLSEFKELDQDDKIMYIQGKALSNEITPDILKILPGYKIGYEGRSTTLANVAIDSGQRFSYNDLKGNEQLLKRYAVFRFRHTDYSSQPISLPFVKFLDEPAKQKYLETFAKDNLTFEYIDKYFGPVSAKKYVNEQVKKLEFLPIEAAKYIDDNNLKKIFLIYSKLFAPWKFTDQTNIDINALEKVDTMPPQNVTPSPIDQKQWKAFSSGEKKTILELATKVNGNNKDYQTLLWALPFIIKNKGKINLILPIKLKDDTYQVEEWCMTDQEGNILIKNIKDILLNNVNLKTSSYGEVDSTGQRIYDISDVKINGKPVE